MGAPGESLRSGRLVASLRALAPLRTVVLILSAELLASTIFICYFCRAFKVSLLLIPIHLPLVAGLLVAALLLPGLLLYNGWVRRWEATKYWMALILGSTFSLVAILYAADYASYFWTGFHLNYKLIYLYLWDLRHGSDLVSLSRSIYLSVLAFGVLVLAIHLAYAESISRGVQCLLLPGRPASLFKNRRRTAKSSLVIVVLLLAYSVSIYFMLRRAPYSELLSNDPFLSLVRSSTEVRDPDYPAFADKVRQQDQNCRNNYPRGARFEKKNVVIIMADALRADHTQVYGYTRATTPFLQTLLDGGHLHKVEFATSTCSGTFCGVMSTLASKPFRWLMPGNYKIYDLLQDQGYNTYLILVGSHDMQGLKEAYGQNVTMFFDYTSSTKYGSTDDRLVFDGLTRVPAYSGTPGFFYIHLMGTHLTGVKQDAFNAYQPTANRNDFKAIFRGENDHWPAVINTYDNSVAQVDATIKQIFEVLEAKGYLRDSLVVIMADHGEGLGERSKYGWGHGHWLYQEFIRIPLLIYDPTPVRYENLAFATQVDVAPTIIDRLGLPIPGCWRGKSFLDDSTRIVTTHRTDSSRPCYAVLSRTSQSFYKYIYCSVGKTEELYDLNEDPKEQRNLIGTADASLVQRLREELQSSNE